MKRRFCAIWVLHLFCSIRLASPSLEGLSCASKALVNDIRHLIEQEVQKKLSISFDFKHNGPSKNEKHVQEVIARESRQQCDVRSISLYDCNTFVTRESTLLFKQFNVMIRDLLNGYVNSNVAINGGYFPIASQLDKFAKQFQNLRQMSGWRLEMGGGAGFGLQTYCDGDFVFTTGAGGGGGMEGLLMNNDYLALGNYYNFTPSFKSNGSNGLRDVNFGGGGGGGLQVNLRFVCDNATDGHLVSLCQRIFRRLDNVSRARANDNNMLPDILSLGGGGGCGTYDYHSETGTNRNMGIGCGRLFDEDYLRFVKEANITQHDVQYILTAMKRRLSKCDLVEVRGGGGGGGGTAECCRSYMIGYGFNFSLTSTKLLLDAYPSELSLFPWNGTGTADTTQICSLDSSRRNSSTEDHFGDLLTSYTDVNYVNRTFMIDSTGKEGAYNASKDTYPSSRGGQTGNEDNYDSYRYIYDPVGGLLHQGSNICGYGSWCCTCTWAQLALAYCCSNTTLPSVPMNGQESSPGQSEYERNIRLFNENPAAANCTIIRPQKDRFMWLKFVHCCPDFKRENGRNDSVDTSDTQTSQPGSQSPGDTDSSGTSSWWSDPLDTFSGNSFDVSWARVVDCLFTHRNISKGLPRSQDKGGPATKSVSHLYEYRVDGALALPCLYLHNYFRDVDMIDQYINRSVNGTQSKCDVPAWTSALCGDSIGSLITCVQSILVGHRTANTSSATSFLSCMPWPCSGRGPFALEKNFSGNKTLFCEYMVLHWAHIERYFAACSNVASTERLSNQISGMWRTLQFLLQSTCSSQTEFDGLTDPSEDDISNSLQHVNNTWAPSAEATVLLQASGTGPYSLSIVFIMYVMIGFSGTLQLLTRRMVPYNPLYNGRIY